jgi:hypothetical protein
MRLLIRYIPVLFSLVVLACNDTEKDIVYTDIDGIWKCEEVDDKTKVLAFNVDIEQVINYDDTYIISNFHNTGEASFIRVSVIKDRLIIARQSLGNTLVTGEGIISPDFKRIALEYDIDSGSSSASYQATFFR